MPVDTTHTQHDATACDWKLMRDVLAGSRAVKEAGHEYLPQLSEQSNPEYDAYRTRAKFFNATARTLQSLTGFIFRKDPTQIIPEDILKFTEDATLRGSSWYDYAKETVNEVVGMGRCGTLVDFNTIENRPYLVRYCPEDIINWKCERRLGRTRLTMLVLHELDPLWLPLTDKEKKDGPPDEYEEGAYDQWRVYRLNEDGQGKLWVNCTIYRKKQEGKKDPEFVAIEQFNPTRRGVALTRIPFIFHNSTDGLPDVGRIPLLDMAEINLAHYRTSADLENGRHYTGLPTPWATGFSSDTEGFKIGSSVAWVTEKENAKVGYLEFTGQGLSSLKEAIEESERQMSALGAKMLEPEAKKAEAYDTVAVRSAAETSALMTMTVACTQSLSAVLQMVAWWVGTAEEPEELRDAAAIELNTEFVSTAMTPDKLRELTAAYLSSAIDFETYYQQLVQGEIIDATRTMEQVRDSIDNNPPGLAALEAQTKVTVPPEDEPTE